MVLDYEQIQNNLCERLCAQVRIVLLSQNLRAIETPFTFPDGDPFQIYLEEQPSGALRLTDNGHTLMQISYDMDIDGLYKGARGVLRQEILGEMGAKEDDGAFYIETSVEDLSAAVFRFGQTLNKIHDLLFLHKTRVKSTFDDDLWESLTKIVPEEKIQKDFAPISEEEQTYRVDYKIDGKERMPIFLYGAPNQSAVRLVTIMLAYFIRIELPFRSLVVFDDYKEIPPGDFTRLMDTGTSMVSSLSAEPEFHNQLRQMVA